METKRQLEDTEGTGPCQSHIPEGDRRHHPAPNRGKTQGMGQRDIGAHPDQDPPNCPIADNKPGQSPFHPS